MVDRQEGNQDFVDNLKMRKKLLRPEVIRA